MPMLARGHRVEDYLHEIAADANDLQYLLRRHPEGFINNQELLKHLNFTVLVMIEVMHNTLKFLLDRQEITTADNTTTLLEQAHTSDLLPDDLVSRVEQLLLLRNTLNSRYPHLKPDHIIRRTHTGIEGFRRFVNTVSPMI